MNKWNNVSLFAFLLRTESKPELVKTEMGPPPSPASTCSDTSSIASSASLPYSKLACVLPFFLLTPQVVFLPIIFWLWSQVRKHITNFSTLCSHVSFDIETDGAQAFISILFSCFSLMLSCGVTTASSEFSAIYLVAESLFNIAYSLKPFVYLVLTEKHYNVTLLFRNLYIFGRLI